MTFTHDSPRDEATDASKEDDELREIWKEGLSAFKASSKQTVDFMPFYEKLGEDVSVENIEEALKGCGIALRDFRKKGQAIRDVLKPLLGLLKAIVDPIGELAAAFGVPGGKAIFGAVARLLQAVDGVTQKYNDLTQVLLNLHQILGRLEVLLNAKAVTPGLRKLYVQTLTQVLVIMGLYIKYCDTTRRPSSWRTKMKVLSIRVGDLSASISGDTAVQDAINRLDQLLSVTQLTTITETLAAATKGHIEVKSLADEQRKMINTQKQKDDLAWLDPSNPYPYQEERLKQGSKVANHARWFLEHESFQQWLKSSYGFFWVSASAGVGKSVLCSEVVKSLQNKECTSGTALAFFYFDSKVSHSQTFEKFLSSVVDGFSKTSSECQKILESFEKKNSNAGESELNSLFDSMLGTSGPKFLVIDALDECEVNERRNSLLPFLQTLGIRAVERGHDFRVFVTSRPEPDIQSILDPAQGHEASLVIHRIQLGEQEEHRATLAAYIEAELASPRFKDLGWSDDTRAHVKKELLVKSNSMFLWVYLQLQELGQCSGHEARQMLTTVPTSLDHTYARILNKIAPRRRCTVQAVLECIIAASRPLTISEIQEIFLLKLGAIPLKPSYLPISDDSDEAHGANLFKLLPGLLKIKNEKEVHFIHFTVQEYLLSHTSGSAPSAALRSLDEALSASMLIFFGTSHEKANATLLLVSLSAFEAAATSTLPNLREYATRSWFIHAKSALPCYPSIAPALAHFLNLESRSFDTWLQHHYKLHLRYGNNLDHPLHWAVRIGSVDEVKRLLNQAQKKGVEICNALDGIRWTPICYAACAGNMQILSTLIKTDNSWPTYHVGPESREFTLMDLLTPDWFYSDPYESYIHVTYKKRQLFRRLWTEKLWPLDDYWKEKPNYLEVLGFLCDAAKPADLFAVDAAGASAFRRLLNQPAPDMAIVKLFLEKGADSKTRTQNGRGVACAAAYSKASTSMIQSLVSEHSIDVNAVDIGGLTPLHIAVKYHAGPECVRAFLDMGADPNLCDRYGWGPLDYARERLSELRRWFESGTDKLVKAQEVYSILEQRGAKLLKEPPTTNIHSDDDFERNNTLT